MEQSSSRPPTVRGLTYWRATFLILALAIGLVAGCQVTRPVEQPDLQVWGAVTLGQASIRFPDLGRAGFTALVYNLGKGEAKRVTIELQPGPALSARLSDSIVVRGDTGPMDLPPGAILNLDGQYFFDRRGLEFEALSDSDLVVVRISWDQQGSRESRELVLTTGLVKAARTR